LGAGAAGINLLMTPFNFWFDYQLALQPMVPRLQVHIMQGAHGFSAAMSILFLAYFAWSRRRVEPRRGDFLYLSYASFSVVGVATVISVSNQLSHGSVVIYAIATFFLMLAAFERPATLVVSVWLCALAIIAATIVWQSTPLVAASAQLNTLLVAISVSVIYPLYDAFRFRDYERQQRLEKLIRLKDTLFRALGHDLRTPLVEVRRVARLLDDADTDLAVYRSALGDRVHTLGCPRG
jgi:signal transduction histidine kinase